MRKIILVLFFYLVVSQIGYGQYANNWLFGIGAGLNFSTTPASTLSGGQTNNPDNSTSISDANGNLLFYTYGVSVWNKNHVIMPNGSGLIGHFTGGQCALIVPIPCDANKYVIFHVTEYSSPGYLSYTVVDMSLNGGLGDVVSSQKNVSLGTGWTEKLCAIYNSSDNSYWVLTHKWNSADFVAFKVSSTSIATQSVVSTIGSSHNCGTYSGTHDAMGQLTISPDGSKVANALTCSDKFEVFNFNVITGVLSNSISIPGDGGKAWGTAFSPNGNKLYVDGIFGSKIYQYNTTTLTQSAVIASQYTVVDVGTAGYIFGYMELGPDAKLYVAKPNANYLSVINNPNSSNASCNFSLVGQSLGNQTSSHGLSRIAYNIPTNTISNTISILSSVSGNQLCAGQSVTLTAVGATSYTWSNASNSPSIIVTPSVTATYSVGGTGACIGTSTNAISFNVNPLPVLTVVSPTGICAGQNAVLTASGAINYTWSTGSNVNTINVSPITTSVYTVSGSAANNCTASSTQTVNVFPNPVLSVSGLTTICIGQTATLLANGASNYVWNNILTGAFISPSPIATTIYTLVGTSGANCSSSLAVTVFVTPSLNISVTGNTFVCVGNTLHLNATGATSYSWNGVQGSSSYTGVPLGNMIFTVSGIDQQSKCSGSTTISIVYSECLQLTETENMESSIQFYPNPFKDRTHFTIKNASIQTPVNCSIFNYLGEKVYSFSYSNFGNEVLLDFSNFNAGIYFLRVGDDSRAFSKIIFKQN